MSEGFLFGALKKKSLRKGFGKALLAAIFKFYQEVPDVIKMDSVKLLTIILIVSLIILLAGLSVWAFQLHGGLAAPIAGAAAAA